MGTPDVRRVLRVRGKFCWNPTDLTGTYPFGGTALGLAKGAAAKVRTMYHTVRAEEYGGIAFDALYLGEEWIVSAVLAAWDADAIPATQLDAAAGATTARPVLQSRVTTEAKRAGALVSAQAGILYFAPDADGDPGVLFPNALPMRPESAEIAFRVTEDFGVPALWLAIPDDTGQAAYVGLRGDLSV